MRVGIPPVCTGVFGYLVLAPLVRIELLPGEYRVECQVDRKPRSLCYMIDEVIPMRSGKSLGVIDPSRSELLSGYYASCFPDQPVGRIPLIGPIERVTFGGYDVSDLIVLAGRELLFELIPSHGGRRPAALPMEDRMELGRQASFGSGSLARLIRGSSSLSEGP